MEVWVGELVAALKLPVVITLLLDCVVSQMNKSISNILKIEVFATSPKVALIVPIALEVHVTYYQYMEDTGRQLNKMRIFEDS